MQKPLEESVKAERLEFLVSIGLDESVFNEFGNKTGADIEVMRASYEFFSELGAVVPNIFIDYPVLLGLHRDSCLEPKLRFFLNDIGLSRKQISKETKLFSHSIDTMVNKYIHFLDKFNENEAQVNKMFRDNPKILGRSTEAIDEKIRKYIEAGIDFHGDYDLLEGIAEKIIDTRNYLNELGIQPSETGKSYYMLLTGSRNLLNQKVVYCEREEIDWRACPKVLILGLGTEEAPGALPRRVEMIKNAFKGAEIPPDLNYKLNPSIIEKLT
ncbi:MAG: hypothetical protein AABX39_05890, partial [Nanoarchaeota archaeon]